MPTLWIHGGVIPPHPFCGAPTEGQVRRSAGGDMAHWHCLVCDRQRDIDPGWPDPLVLIGLEDWHAMSRRMSARVRALWQDAGSSHDLGSAGVDPVLIFNRPRDSQTRFGELCGMHLSQARGLFGRGQLRCQALFAFAAIARRRSTSRR